jgi:hypothetical protein
VTEKIDKVLEHYTNLMLDFVLTLDDRDGEFQHGLHKYALEDAGLTDEEFLALSESEDNSDEPRMSVYWLELAALHTRIMAATQVALRHFRDDHGKPNSREPAEVVFYTQDMLKQHVGKVVRFRYTEAPDSPTYAVYGMFVDYNRNRVQLRLADGSAEWFWLKLIQRETFIVG